MSEAVSERIKSIISREITAEIASRKDEFRVIQARIAETRALLDKLRVAIASHGTRLRRTDFSTEQHPSSSSSSTLAQPPSKPTTGNPPSRAAAAAPSKPSLVVYRRLDGSLVKIVCPACGKERFVNYMGFVHHCRTAHGLLFASLDDAIFAAGVPTELSELPSGVSITKMVSVNTSALASSSTSAAAAGQLQIAAGVRVAPLVEPAAHPARSRFYLRKRIVVGNTSKFIPANKRDKSDPASHKWMIYVRGPAEEPDIAHFVRKVVFCLHPSYQPNDVLEVTSPPFHLTRRGWGEFPIRVQLHFFDTKNKPIDVVHYLKLDRSLTGLQTLGAETTVDIELHKAFFEQSEQERRRVREEAKEKAAREDQALMDALRDEQHSKDSGAIMSVEAEVKEDSGGAQQTTAASAKPAARDEEPPSAAALSQANESNSPEQQEMSAFPVPDSLFDAIYSDADFQSLSQHDFSSMDSFLNSGSQASEAPHPDDGSDERSMRIARRIRTVSASFLTADEIQAANEILTSSIANTAASRAEPHPSARAAEPLLCKLCGLVHPTDPDAPPCTLEHEFPKPYKQAVNSLTSSDTLLAKIEKFTKSKTVTRLERIEVDELAGGPDRIRSDAVDPVGQAETQAVVLDADELARLSPELQWTRLAAAQAGVSTQGARSEMESRDAAAPATADALLLKASMCFARRILDRCVENAAAQLSDTPATRVITPVQVYRALLQIPQADFLTNCYMGRNLGGGPADAPSEEESGKARSSEEPAEKEAESIAPVPRAPTPPSAGDPSSVKRSRSDASEPWSNFTMHFVLQKPAKAAGASPATASAAATGADTAELSDSKPPTPVSSAPSTPLQIVFWKDGLNPRGRRGGPEEVVKPKAAKAAAPAPAPAPAESASRLRKRKWEASEGEAGREEDAHTREASQEEDPRDDEDFVDATRRHRTKRKAKAGRDGGDDGNGDGDGDDDDAGAGESGGGLSSRAAAGTRRASAKRR